MNRRKFFKKIGAVTATTIILPHVILAEVPPVVETISGNVGLWHQLQRGKTVKYSAPNGLTREHIRQAVEYVFKENNNLPVPERFARFETGSEGRKAIRKQMHAYIINGVTYTT